MARPRSLTMPLDLSLRWVPIWMMKSLPYFSARYWEHHLLLGGGEVHVEVRQRRTTLGHEPLEGQLGLDRIHLGDVAE